MNDLFRFIGDEVDRPEIFDPEHWYKKNKIYMLELRGRGMTDLGVVIDSPIRCPYASWETFFENWERV